MNRNLFKNDVFHSDRKRKNWKPKEVGKRMDNKDIFKNE